MRKLNLDCRPPAFITNARVGFMLENWKRPYRGIPEFIWKLLFIQFLMNAGHFMAIPLLAVHLSNNLQFGAASIGTVLTIHLLAARLLPAVAGPVADRLGPRGLMVAGLLVRAIGLFGLAYFQSLSVLAVAAFLMGAGTSLYESAVYGVFARQPKDIAAKIFIINNQALNAGVIIGPLVGTFVATLGTAHAFVASGAVFAILAFWAVSIDLTKGVTFEHVGIWRNIRTVVIDRTFIVLFVTTLPWWFLFTQLFVVFPIHVVSISGSEAIVGTMFLVNGVVGMVFMFVSILVFERIGARTILIASYIGLAIIYPLVPISQAIWWFLGLIGLYTIAETHILPAIDTATAEIARQGSEATYFGAASLAWAAAGSLGNYVGSWLILETDPETVWAVFSAVACLGVCLAIWFRALPVSVDGAP